MSAASPKRNSKVYMSKHKKSRSAALSRATEDDADSASDIDSGTGTGKHSVSASATPSKSTPSKPTRKLPIVEIPTPTKPISKHARTASGTMGPPTTPARTPGPSALGKGRSPSLSSMKPASTHGSPAAHSATDSPTKSLSAARRASPTPSDSAASASASISAAGARTKRKTPGDRQAEIAADVHCGEVEPTRAFCRTCDAWIALSDKTPFSTRPWMQHVREQHATPGAKVARRRPSRKNEDSEAEADDASTAAPSVSEATVDREPLRSEAQRKAMLKADPRVEEVRAHEVLCRECSKWVKLRADRTFDIHRWRMHCDSCSGVQPSDRVAAAERRLKLVNDSQAMDVEAHSVRCQLCRMAVELSGPGEYNLTSWEAHKAGDCTQPEITTESGSVPTSSERPPPSVASEGTTAAAERASESPKRMTGKRAREEDEADVVPERPVQRARTESYEAPTGVWNWLTYPIKSFMAGVRQGMGLEVEETMTADGQ